MADDLDRFLWAISKQESGHDYGAVGPQTSKYGKALGRYQVMSKIAPHWMREIGLQGSDEQLADQFLRTPGIQDRVARHKMSEYYRQYGSWDLVAIAWFAGPGRANTAKQHGIDAVGGISDVLGTDVRTYVNTAMGSMGQAQGGRQPGVQEGTGAPTSPSRPPNTLPSVQPKPEQPGVRQAREAQLNQGTLESIMASISKAASSGGGKLLDVQAMFGDKQEVS